MPNQNPHIVVALNASKRTQARYRKAERYAHGDQPDVYPRKDWVAEMKTVPQPRDNIAVTVIESLVSRLHVTGYQTSEQHTELLDGIVERCRLAEQLPAAFRTAATKGDVYLMVSERAGKAIVTRQNPAQCHIEYDPEYPTEPVWQAKWWTVGDSVRVNLYYRTHTERWVCNTTDGSVWSVGNVFVPFSTDTVEHLQKNPLGVLPLFHLPNGAPSGELGRSELHPVYPLIDQINIGLCDLALAMKAVGWPWRTGTGITADNSEQITLGGDTTLGGGDTTLGGGENTLTEPATSEPSVLGGMARILTVENPDASFQQFPAATLDGPIKYVDNLREAVARNSRRPPHALGLGGGVATATEVNIAEGLFIAEVKTRQTVWGAVLQDLLELCLLIETSHNGTGFVSTPTDAPQVTVSWAPAHTVFEPSEADLLQLASDVLPTEDLLVRYYGYTPTDAVNAVGRKQAQREAEASAAVGAFTHGYGL